MKQKFLSFLDAARRKRDAFAVKARIEAGSAAAALTDTRGEQNTSCTIIQPCFLEPSKIQAAATKRQKSCLELWPQL